jgi:hypothetical protein
MVFLKNKMMIKKIYQIIRNDGLTGSIVDKGQFLDHFTGILCSVLHGRSSSSHFRGVALSHSPVDVVGKGELFQRL